MYDTVSFLILVSLLKSSVWDMRMTSFPAGTQGYSHIGACVHTQFINALP
jgi:hypothetical protein